MKMAMKARKCRDAAIGLSEQDATRFDEIHNRYVEAGQGSLDAARHAAADLLAELEGERADIVQAIAQAAPKQEPPAAKKDLSETEQRRASRDGKSQSDRLADRIDWAAAELSGQFANDVAEDDFDPSELRPIVEIRAKEDNVPADDLRQAIIKRIDGYDIKAAQKKRVKDALSPTKAAAASAAKKKDDAAIVDFGSKIGGARKDVWNSFKDAMQEAEGLDVATAPLSKSWPAPDYQALLDGGSDPWAVAFMHAVRDEVPAKPKRAWKLKTWAAQVTMLRDLGMKALDGRVDAAIVREKLAEAAKTSRGLTDVSGRSDLYQLVGHGKSLSGVSITSGQYSIYQGVEYKPPKIIWTVEKQTAATAFSNWPRQLASGATRDEALANFKAKYAEMEISPPAGKEASFEIFSKRSEKGYWIGKKIGRNPTLLEGPFETIKEARAYKAEHNAELVAKLEKFKEIPNVRRDTNEPRVGEDMRDGQNVTSEMFKESFGFRGVEFGNYVEQKKRQQDLNNAFDALMDMAAVLGVNPKALSLNGELGLAFGARGHGGTDAAAAHYERDFVVINLTKKDGAGSLGHEWWHALDNYFSRMRGKKSDMTTDALDVSLASRGSPFVHQGDVRKEMIEAFGEVLKSIRATAIRARAAKLDAKRTKDYWKTEVEMSARAFESYLIAKLQDQGASNDYLANIVDAETWAAAEKLGFELEGSYPYPLPGEVPTIRAGFDHFFRTVETRETDKGVALFSRRSSVQNGAYETDLFGNPVSAGANRAARSDGPGLLGNVQPAAAVPGDTEAPDGQYHVRIIVGSETRRRLGTDRILTAEQAATATRYLYRSAVERVDAIVTDAKGAPLAVVGGFKGALTQASVYPATLMGEAVRVPGAAKIWFSHNHPSGVAELSQADRLLGSTLSNVFRGSGIEPMGILVVAGGRFAFASADAAIPAESGVIPDSSASVEVPVIERELVPNAVPAVSITSPAMARSYGATYYQQAKAPGLMLLNAQNGVVAWVPLPPQAFGDLRYTGGLRSLYRAISETPAGAAILVHGGELADGKMMQRGVSVAENIGAALGNIDVRLLDVIDAVGNKSYAESGLSLRAGPVYSKAGTGTGLPAAEVTRIADAVRKAWANGPEVVVVDGMADERIPAAVRQAEQQQRSNGATGDVEGFYDSGTVYVVASSMTSEADVVRVVQHEALGHYGLRGLYGERLGTILDQIANVRRGEIAAKVKEYGLPDTKAGRRVAAEELLAVMAQKNPQMGFVKKAIAAIRQWLRELGFRFAVTDADIIAQFILPARAFVERGPDAMAQGESAFARAALTSTEAFKRWFGESKVVDESGAPLVVYHGTTQSFDAFAPETGWFTAAPSEASVFGGLNGDGAQVMPAYISIQRPAIVRGEDVANWRSAIFDALTHGAIDGVIVTLEGKPHWVVPRDPTQIKSATGNRGTFDPANPDIRFSRKPLWFSPLARAIEGINAKAQPASAWSAQITSLKGIKPDEIEWSGIKEWLALQQGKVTKDAVLEYLAGNGVRVEETVMGDGVRPAGAESELTARQIEITEDDSDFWTADAPTGNRLIAKKYYPTEGEAREFALRYFNSQIAERNRERAAAAGVIPKFGSYRVPGQSKNYRELLLTLPAKATNTVVDHPGGEGFAIRRPDGSYVTNPPTAAMNAGRPTRWDTRELAARWGIPAVGNREGTEFRGSHWDQPNVLAHIRVDERTDADGKRVLFVNELQSDWAQKGRKYGFKTADRLIDGHDYDWWSREADRLMSAKPFDRDAAMRAAENRNALAGKPDEVARGPFVEKTDAWVALALKRIIRYAVDNGFDRVAIVSGEQAAKMFNLSEHVTRLYYDRDGRGYILSADGSRGEVFPRDMQYSDEELDGVVGKEIAQKIRNREGREDDENGGMILEGVDLEVGGEGMEKFYPRSDLGPVGTDKDGKPIYPIVQLVAQKVLKQLGGRPTTVNLGEFAKGNVYDGNKQVATNVTREKYDSEWGDGYRFVQMNDPAAGMEQLGFDITPEMRDTVLEQGMPMFSRRPTVAGVQAAVGQAAQAIKGATLKDTWQRTVNAWKDKKPLALQLLGRRQIVDIYGTMLPEIVDYSHRMQQYDADKNEASASADEIVNDWRKLPDADELADVMHGATLVGYDPDKSKTPADMLTPEMREVYDGYQALTPEAKAIYKRARDAYAKHWALVKKAIGERIEERAKISDNDRKALMEKYRDQFLKPIEGVYFPLARFGDYIITAKDANGDRVVAFAETINEAVAEQARMKREYTDVSKITKRKEYNAARDAVSKDFVQKLFEAIDESAVDGNEAEMLKDSVNQLYLTSLPDVSWAKHGIHRKGTAGYNRDARRAFAASMFHGGYHLAKLRHADVLAEYLRAAQSHIDGKKDDEGYDSITAQQVVDEMLKRHDQTMNPDNSAIVNKLTGMGFIWYLGLSPASAIVNLSQTALVAYPLIGARFGFGRASAELMRASKEAVKFKNDLRGRYTGDVNDAIDRAIREGLIDITQAHDLAGIAEGRDSQLHGALSPVMRAASWMFHQAEKFNRQATFLATYRLARADGKDADHAYEIARELTYKGHFDYAASNRPRVMMGPAARVLFLFKQYGQNMIYTLTRNAFLAAKGDREALRALSGLMVAHGLTAGTLGLPLASVLMGAASLLGSGDDEPWDAEVAYRNYLADAVGPAMGEVISRGVFRAIFPGDIASRVGLDQLLIRDIDLTMEPGRLWQELLHAVLGPVAGIFVNASRGAADVARGDVMVGVENMLPKAIKDGLKTVRYSQEGVKDRTGVNVLDEVTARDLIAQVTGFAPARVAEAYAGRRAVFDQQRKLKERRDSLLRDFSRAVMQKDNESRLKALQEIQHFNQTNPKTPITSQSMLRSVQNRVRRQNEAQNGIYLPRKQRDLAELGRFANTE